MPKFIGMLLLTVALGLSMALGSSPALGQSWPSRPVRFIVGTGAGGGTDVVARVVAADLSKRLGQQFIVENRIGGNSSIAAHAVKAAPPDGYMLFAGSAAPFTSLVLKENYIDASREFQPVTLLSYGESFVIVRADLGVTTLRELAAKAQTTRLRMGSPTPNAHALMAVVAKSLNFQYDNIPYKTTDQIAAALLAGESDFTIAGLTGFHVESGKLRPLITIGPVRSPFAPDIPTARESGANLGVRFGYGMWAPLGTPRDVVEKLGTATAESLRSSDVAEKIKSQGLVPTTSSPEELVRAYLAEIDVYREAFALVGIKPE